MDIQYRGDIYQFLVANELVGEYQLEQIRFTADFHDISPIKSVLNYGFAVRKDYEFKLKEAEDITFTDVRSIEFETPLTELFDIQWLNRRVVAPLRTHGGKITVAMCDPFDYDSLLEIERISGLKADPVYASDLDVMWVMHKHYGIPNVKRAVFELADKDRERSALISFTETQLLIIFLLIAATIVLLFFFPVATIVTVNAAIGLIFFGSVFFKFLLALLGSQVETKTVVTRDEVLALNEDELPTYTIQLPVYKESEVVTKLVGNIKNIDYPRHLLDVKLLVEEDDDVTLDALRNLDIPGVFEPLIIPHHQPKTKPKACNYGLYYTRAQMLTIYDAEDIPDSDQLKRAVALFAKLPEEYVIIQCCLNYYNRGENALTRMFTMEYSGWFDYMLPGLHMLKVPIPLGGTSNHFKFDTLMELGGWDPFNVTEDADLGIRTYARGYKVGVLDSTTYEEANKAPGNWIRQRSRWIKGYMQTWLVHMRHPVELIRTIGWKGFFGFQLFIGGTFMTFLLYPILLALFIIYLVFPPDFYGLFFPDFVMGISIINLMLGNALIIYVNMMAVFKRKYFDLIFFALFNPVYWLMHSISAYKGLWQLITRPFYWEKTTHGLTSHKTPKQ